MRLSGILQKNTVSKTKIEQTHFESKPETRFSDAHECFLHLLLSDGQKQYNVYVLFPSAESTEDALIIYETDDAEESSAQE